MAKNSGKGTTSRIISHYPPVKLSAEEKAEDFGKIWPEMEKLVKDADKGLFKKFSFFIYRSFSENLSSLYTPEQVYATLRHYYDFFLKDFDTAEDPGSGKPRALVHVDSSTNEGMEFGGGKISVTGIMIHAVDSPFLFENLGGYLNIAGLQILSVIHPVITVKRD
ncbi:MAG: hypothetical protein V3S46_09540, partial [Nitrospinota bacterium]